MAQNKHQACSSRERGTARAGAPRATGLQGATAAIVGALDSCLESLPPRESAALVDILSRRLARERRRYERWAA